MYLDSVNIFELVWRFYIAVLVWIYSENTCEWMKYYDNIL